MGFSAVYRCLHELFPQLDARVLKAVAIQNSKDADAAVEVVLSEILPYISVHKNPQSSPSQYLGSLNLSDGEVRSDQPSSLSRRRSMPKKANAASSEAKAASRNGDTISSNSNLVENTPRIGQEASTSSSSDKRGRVFETDELTALEKDRVRVTRVIEANQAPDVRLTTEPKPHSLTESAEVILLGTTNRPLDTPGKSLHVGPAKSSDISSLTTADAKFNQRGSYGSQADDCNMSRSESSYRAESTLTSTSLKTGHSGCEQVSEHLLVAPKCHLEADSINLISNNAGEKAEEDDASSKHCFGEESPLKLKTTCSGKIHELFKPIIENAEAYKCSMLQATLFSAMDLVVNLTREVEEKEKVAKQAKEEASTEEHDIYLKIEELNRMLVLTKEANDMYAGEVHGERAILSTEAKELQSHLLRLLEERDKSLAIIVQMRQELEIRLSAAEDLKKVAEKEKLEKEATARRVLAEQQALLEKVFHQSKLLQEKEEQNNKLRMFLMDHGHVVDALQGEIAVICQDVKSLKENFDRGIQLSKSVSSRKMSRISSSASSSDLSSISTDTIPEQGKTLKILNKIGPLNSIDDIGSPSKRVIKEEEASIGRKELEDEGWELCEGN
ncbi:CUE domain-containing protein [Psidium guajava]|nr:CUE domain-containing protein [Psidium guajava]